MLTSRAAIRPLQRLAARNAPVRVTRRNLASEPQMGFKPSDNAFNREREAVRAHAKGSAELWRKLSIYVTIPALAIFGANAWVLWNEHWEHEAHEPPPSERPQYAYLNIRTKPYPWGDGNKTAFWNPKVNYVKDE